MIVRHIPASRPNRAGSVLALCGRTVSPDRWFGRVTRPCRQCRAADARRSSRAAPLGDTGTPEPNQTGRDQR